MSADPNTSAPASTPWWRNEDWLALVAALPLLAAVVLGWKVKLPALAWKSGADLGNVFGTPNLLAIGTLSGVLILLAALVLAASLGRRALAFLGGAGVVFALAWLAQWLAANASIKAYGLEYVIFALALGLLWSHLLPVPA